MSHYAVLVLHEENQDIEDLLAPYDENIKVEPYLIHTRQEALNKIKKEFVPNNDYFKGQTDQELLDWYCNEYGAYSQDNEGNIYSTYNPDSKWDWWSIGGRFSEELELTDEVTEQRKKEYKEKYDDEYDNEWLRYVDEAKVSEIKWIKTLTDEEKDKIRKWWEDNIYNPTEDKKDKYFFYNPEYYKQRYKDPETDIMVQQLPCYHAIVTSDGVWHEPSKMGWFACTDGEPEDELQWDLTFYDTFIKPNLNSDLLVTVVDCHI